MSPVRPLSLLVSLPQEVALGRYHYDLIRLMVHQSLLSKKLMLCFLLVVTEAATRGSNLISAGDTFGSTDACTVVEFKPNKITFLILQLFVSKLRVFVELVNLSYF